MRYITLAPLSLLALMTLAACGKSEPESFNGAPDPMAEQLANAPAAELPPPVKANKTYRCKDNSLVYIDYFADDLSANIRTDKTTPPTRLKAAEKGKPFEAEGYVVDGSGATVTITLPGKSAQSCKA
ncbi:MAG: hypothetical protein ABW184_06720 [Sphingobium sp.]